MDLNEAINILNNTGYLIEKSPLENEYGVRNIYGHNFFKNDSSTLKLKNKDKISDTIVEEGEDWITVKKKDTITLSLAILDGILEFKKMYAKLPEDEKYAYEVFFDEPDIQNFNDINDKNIHRLIEKYKDVIDDILNFLKKYMHGTFTVYRGLSLSPDVIKKYKNYRGALAKALTNKNKFYNSFSPDIDDTMAYANPVFADYDNIPVIIAGEATPNIINFAFTAYILGRDYAQGLYSHNTYNLKMPRELNISNLHELKNLRIVKMGKDEI